MALRRMSRFVLEVASTLVLVALYLVVVTIVGGILRLFGRNPLRHKPGEGGFWQPHQGAATPKAMERQS